MTMFPDAYQLPGLRAEDFTRESAVCWGKDEQKVVLDAVIAAATVWNNGSADETNLPGGLLLGGPVSGKVKQWDPTDTTGYEKLFGVLLHDQRMLNAAGTATDRFAAPILVGGRVKASGLYISGYSKATSMTGNAELAARAALTQTGRFIVDDDLGGNPFGGILGLKAKTAAYTLVEGDNNYLFTNLGATGAVKFTLPAPRLGYRAVFYVMAAQTITLTRASGTPMVVDGDATVGEVNLTEGIGTWAELLGVSATQYVVKVGRPLTPSLITDRIKLLWIAGQRGKPGINADIQNAAESVRMIADPDFEILGTNGTSALCTFNAEGGIILTTAGASADQMIVAPHLDTDQSAWTKFTWGTDRKTDWECLIQTGSAAQLVACTLWAGLKLTNTPVIATDNDQAFFRYQDTVLAGNWQINYSIGGTDTAVDSGIAVAASTVYRLRVSIDAGRIARFYINGVLVATSTALTTTTDLIPYIGVQEDVITNTKIVNVFGQSISRDRLAA